MLKVFSLDCPVFNKHTYLIIGIICLGFSLRFLFLLRNPNFNCTDFEGPLPSEISYFKGDSPHDSQEYKALALNMLKHRRFSWNSEPVVLRTPGYPLFIAAIYSLFPKEETDPTEADSDSRLPRDWAVMLVQVFLSTASIYLIYLIGKNSWNEKDKSKDPGYGYWAGIIPAFLFSLNPTSILFSSLFMAETLFVFFILTGSWLFLKNRSPWTGFIFGASALIRPIALYIFIPLIFLQSSFTNTNHHKEHEPPQRTRTTTKKGIIFLVLFFLPILPWMARNLKVYNSPVFTSIQGCNLLFFNASILESEELGISFKEAHEEAIYKLWESLDDSITNPLQVSRQAQKIAIRRIMRSPFRYTFIHFKRTFHMFLPTKVDDVILRTFGRDVTQSRFSKFVLESKGSLSLKFVVVLFTGIEVLVTLGSLLLAVIGFIRSPRYPNLFFALIVGYFSVISGIIICDGRFRLPLIPYIYLLASGTKWIRRK